MAHPAHDNDENREKGDLDIGALAAVAAVGVLVVVLSVVLLQAFYYKTEDRAFAEAYAEPLLDVKKVTSEQLQLLSGAGQVAPEPGKGTMRIPIDRAIELVARDGARAWPAPPASPPAPATAAPGAPGAAATPGAIAPPPSPVAAPPPQGASPGRH
jgi:hypothetical protein